MIRNIPIKYTDKMLIKGVEIANYALSAISDTRKRIGARNTRIKTSKC